MLAGSDLLPVSWTVWSWNFPVMISGPGNGKQVTSGGKCGGHVSSASGFGGTGGELASVLELCVCGEMQNAPEGVSSGALQIKMVAGTGFEPVTFRL